jgi:peptidoglycan/xylan/chitin deacetylase (PgdA/CDA1 family)
MKSAIALTFHRINPVPVVSHSPMDPATGRYVITNGHFKQLINMISPEKCCTISEYIEKQEGDWLILTFDDGSISDFEVGFPGLKNKGIKATFFITVENIGLSGYTTITHLREMAERGMEIGSHGLTHQYLLTMARNEASREIRESKDRLEQAIGKNVVSFAPVGGHYRKWMEEVAYETGYRAFATMIPGRTNGGESTVLLHRNHIQSRHDSDYLSRLIDGHYRTMALNRLRYHVLQIPKVVLGINNYDLVKKYLLRIFNAG